MTGIAPRTDGSCEWDLVSLGEVMLRLDPGEGRVATARQFRAWEGGGEYNVARGLRRAFGLRTTIVTALADNLVGRLIEDLMLQGGVDLRHVRWVPHDGVGRTARNGLNFTERGFGIRAGVGCSDRGHTAVSQLAPGDIDWDTVFRLEGARWFHTGGIFAALSATTPLVAAEAMSSARNAGTIVSYDLNYRASLWQGNGGPQAARTVNSGLVGLADVLFGNEEDFNAALGFDVEGLDDHFASPSPDAYKRMLERVVDAYPNLRLVAATLRGAHTATRNDWSAVCWAGGRVFEGPRWDDLEVLDRIGSGDSFASGLIYGVLRGEPPERALAYGVAHGALAMTTPGDASMVTAAEVHRVMARAGARIER